MTLQESHGEGIESWIIRRGQANERERIGDFEPDYVWINIPGLGIWFWMWTNLSEFGYSSKLQKSGLGTSLQMKFEDPCTIWSML